MDSTQKSKRYLLNPRALMVEYISKQQYIANDVNEYRFLWNEVFVFKSFAASNSRGNGIAMYGSHFAIPKYLSFRNWREAITKARAVKVAECKWHKLRFWSPLRRFIQPDDPRLVYESWALVDSNDLRVSQNPSKNPEKESGIRSQVKSFAMGVAFWSWMEASKLLILPFIGRVWEKPVPIKNSETCSFSDPMASASSERDFRPLSWTKSSPPLL